MYDTYRDLLDALTTAPDVFEGLLANVTQQQAQSARGGDEGWSIVEVMCHMRDAEERGLERMREMRDKDNPDLPGYDQDAWARDRNYAAADLHEALAAFLKIRAQRIAEVMALTPEQWERTGIHEEQGQITIFTLQIHMVAHDLIHAAQIARQLRQVAP